MKKLVLICALIAIFLCGVGAGWIITDLSPNPADIDRAIRILEYAQAQHQTYVDNPELIWWDSNKEKEQQWVDDYQFIIDLWLLYVISFPQKGGAISQEKAHLILSLVRMKKMFYSKWHENIRCRILKYSAPKLFCLLPMDFKTNKSVRNSMYLEKSSAIRFDSGNRKSLQNSGKRRIRNSL